MMRLLRWTSQLAVLALLVVAPALQIWAVGATTRWDPVELGWRYGLLAPDTVELLNSWLGRPSDDHVGQLVGAPWSLSLAGLELTDPIAAASLLAGGVAPPAAMLVGVAIVLAINLLLGRVFCGWFCPYGTLSRLLSRLRPPLVRWGIAHHWRPPTWLGLVVLAAVVLAPLLGASLAWAALPYLALGRSVHALFFGGFAGVAGVVGALLLSDLLLWNHGVCRSLCPSGALQTQLGRWRVFRLVALRTANCQKGCHACGEACWLGLDPRRGHLPSGCDACGRCIPKCPETRLALRFTQDASKKAHTTAALLALVLLPGLSGCGDSDPAPELISNRVWSSAFEEKVDPGHDPQIVFVEVDGLSVGVVQREPGSFGLRVYLLEDEESAWRGPLRVLVDTPGGALEVDWERASTPRSVPRASIYEATIAGAYPQEVTVLSEPGAGRGLRIPSQRPFPWSLAPLFVVGLLWGVGHLARPVLEATGGDHA